METDWAENRAKLPQDIIRRTHRQAARLALLDRRARQVPHPPRAHAERQPRSTSATAAWTRSTSARSKDQTVWQPRPTDPAARGRVPAPPDGASSGAKEEQAKATVAARAARRRSAPARARVVDGQPARRCRSTTASTAPGAASAWRSTAAASPSKTATAPRACTSCATSTRAAPASEEPGFFGKLFSFGAQGARATPASPRTASRSRPKATTQHGRRC